MKPAARITDMHTCPLVNPGPVPHVGGPISVGSPNVLTCFLPQARVSDMAVCVGPPDMIAMGSPTVLVNFLPAARLGDSTAHGGVIVAGCPRVLIGDSGGGGGGGGAGAGGGGETGASDTDAFGPLAVLAIGAVVAAVGVGVYVLTKDKKVNYSKGVDIKGSDEFIKKTTESLDKLNATPTGKAVLEDIGKSGKNVTIVETKDKNGYKKALNLSDANLKSDGTPGKGSDSQTSFNPDFKPGGIPAEVVLGHELIHAQHAARGTRETAKTKGVKNEELKTVGLPPFPETGMTENSLRKDLGVKKRKKY